MAVAWEEYFRLAFEEKRLLKPLEQDRDDSPTLQLILEKKQELAAADQGLQAQKKEFRSSMDSVNQRWTELEQKGQALKGSVVSFNQQFKEVEFRRAARKAIEERRRMRNLEAEAVRLRAQLKELRLQQARLLRKVRRLEPCARVLERALEWVPHFQEVSDLVARFESLVDTQAALKRAELRRQVEMEVTRARLLSLQKEKQDNLLRLNQERTRLCEKLEAARELTQQWESRWTEVQNTASEKTLLLGRLRMAVLNLYQLVRLKQGQKQALAVEDMEGQLEEVKLFIVNASATLANSPQAKPTPTFEPGDQ
ncbi:cilia- and flagella-associated protein 73 isoform X2 [Arvicanthis niloticus]|uniref:cilia- and flagella-associated protein 73 isoform X2 n=1 Tax=Arvicanthis niloticus TaxID=61156 RepID=UPI0014870029|nr:cilia- and flagella-associated protein 73 [Arvicanthis niloticus]